MPWTTGILALRTDNQVMCLFNEGRVHRFGTPDEVLNYQTIEEVYKTIVIVEKNPITGKPYVFLVSGRKIKL